MSASQPSCVKVDDGCDTHAILGLTWGDNSHQQIKASFLQFHHAASNYCAHYNQIFSNLSWLTWYNLIASELPRLCSLQAPDPRNLRRNPYLSLIRQFCRCFWSHRGICVNIRQLSKLYFTVFQTFNISFSNAIYKKELIHEAKSIGGGTFECCAIYVAHKEP